MSKRNSPNDIKNLDDLNRLKDIVFDKRNHKRATEKKNTTRPSLSKTIY